MLSSYYYHSEKNKVVLHSPTLGNLQGIIFNKKKSFKIALRVYHSCFKQKLYFCVCVCVCECAGKCTEKFLEEYIYQLFMLDTSRENKGLRKQSENGKSLYFFCLESFPMRL